MTITLYELADQHEALAEAAAADPDDWYPETHARILAANMRHRIQIRVNAELKSLETKPQEAASAES